MSRIRTNVTRIRNTMMIDWLLIIIFFLQKAEVVTLEDNDEDKLDFEADEPEN